MAAAKISPRIEEIIDNLMYRKDFSLSNFYEKKRDATPEYENGNKWRAYFEWSTSDPDTRTPKTLHEVFEYLDITQQDIIRWNNDKNLIRLMVKEYTRLFRQPSVLHLAMVGYLKRVAGGDLAAFTSYMTNIFPKSAFGIKNPKKIKNKGERKGGEHKGLPSVVMEAYEKKIRGNSESTKVIDIGISVKEKDGEGEAIK